MGYFCYKCGTEQVLSSNAFVGRKEECASCRCDLHCCLNCAHYDKAAYNQCRESQAERVLDKDRSNFCDYFRFADRTAGQSAADPKTLAKKKLDDLFK